MQLDHKQHKKNVKPECILQDYVATKLIERKVESNAIKVVCEVCRRRMNEIAIAELNIGQFG